MKPLRDLALALCNATLLLLVVLMVVALMLLGRLTDLRDETIASVSAGLAPFAAPLERIDSRLSALNEQLESADGSELRALRDEVALLRAQLPDLARLEQVGTGEIARGILKALAAQLSRYGS